MSHFIVKIKQNKKKTYPTILPQVFAPFLYILLVYTTTALLFYNKHTRPATHTTTHFKLTMSFEI